MSTNAVQPPKTLVEALRQPIQPNRANFLQEVRQSPSKAFAAWRDGSIKSWTTPLAALTSTKWTSRHINRVIGDTGGLLQGLGITFLTKVFVLPYIVDFAFPKAVVTGTTLIASAVPVSVVNVAAIAATSAFTVQYLGNWLVNGFSPEGTLDSDELKHIGEQTRACVDSLQVGFALEKSNAPPSVDCYEADMIQLIHLVSKAINAVHDENMNAVALAFAIKGHKYSEASTLATLAIRAPLSQNFGTEDRSVVANKLAASIFENNTLLTSDSGKLKTIAQNLASARSGRAVVSQDDLKELSQLAADNPDLLGKIAMNLPRIVACYRGKDETLVGRVLAENVAHADSWLWDVCMLIPLIFRLLFYTFERLYTHQSSQKDFDEIFNNHYKSRVDAYLDVFGREMEWTDGHLTAGLDDAFFECYQAIEQAPADIYNADTTEPGVQQILGDVKMLDDCFLLVEMGRFFLAYRLSMLTDSSVIRQVGILVALISNALLFIFTPPTWIRDTCAWIYARVKRIGYVLRYGPWAAAALDGGETLFRSGFAATQAGIGWVRLRTKALQGFQISVDRHLATRSGEVNIARANFLKYLEAVERSPQTVWQTLGPLQESRKTTLQLLKDVCNKIRSKQLGAALAEASKDAEEAIRAQKNGRTPARLPVLLAYHQSQHLSLDPDHGLWRNSAPSEMREILRKFVAKFIGLENPDDALRYLFTMVLSVEALGATPIAPPRTLRHRMRSMFASTAQPARRQWTQMLGRYNTDALSERSLLSMFFVSMQENLRQQWLMLPQAEATAALQEQTAVLEDLHADLDVEGDERNFLDITRTALRRFKTTDVQKSEIIYNLDAALSRLRSGPLAHLFPAPVAARPARTPWYTQYTQLIARIRGLGRTP